MLSGFNDLSNYMTSIEVNEAINTAISGAIGGSY